MQISAKADYAARAMLEIALHGPGLVKASLLISHQDMPAQFVKAILSELRHAGLLISHRGAGGGYTLAAPPSKITIGAIVRAVDAPLSGARESRYEADYQGAAQHLPLVWSALETDAQRLLDETTLAQVLAGQLPPRVLRTVNAGRRGEVGPASAAASSSA